MSGNDYGNLIEKWKVELIERRARRLGFKDHEIPDLEQEIVDRYGPALPEVQNLIELTALKTHLRWARVLSLSVSSGQLNFQLDTGTGFDPGPLAKLIAEQSDRATLDLDGWLRVRLDPEDRADPLPVARSVAARMVALMGHAVKCASLETSRAATGSVRDPRAGGKTT